LALGNWLCVQGRGFADAVLKGSFPKDTAKKMLLKKSLA
jgi:hypothetical protein